MRHPLRVVDEIVEGPHEIERSIGGRRMMDAHQDHVVLLVNVVEHPVTLVPQGGQVQRCSLKHVLSPGGHSVIGEGGSGQNDSYTAGFGAGEMPVPPGEGFVQVGMGAAYPGIRSGHQHGPRLVVVDDVALVKRLQIGSGPPHLVDGVVHLLLIPGTHPWQMSSPPNLLFDHHLLPGRVAQQAVEAGAITQEHLGEGGREVQRGQRLARRGHARPVGLADEDGLVEELGQGAGPGPVGGDQVEQRSGPGHRLLGVLVGGTGLVDLPFGGVGGAGQPPQRALGRGQQLLKL